MRILFLEAHPRFGGGSERFSLDLCRHAAARGHQTWLAYRDVGDMVAFYSASGADCRRLELWPLVARSMRRSWQSVAGVRRIVTRERIDVIFTSHLGMVSLMVLARLGTPARTAAHLGLHVKPSRTLAMGFRHLQLAVAPSAHIAALWTTSLLQTGHVRVVANGIDTTTFSPVDSEARARLRVALGVRSLDVPLIAYVGRIVREKGVDTLLRAFARYRAAGRPGTLVLAGPIEPGEMTHLRGVAHDERIPANDWVVIPPTSAPENVYRAADLVVLPSETEEPFGLAPIEAIACGTAALVSDRGLLPTLVEPVGQPLVFRAGDAADLCDRLVVWFADRVAALRETTRLTAHVRRTFDFAICGDRYLAEFAELTCPYGRR